MFKTLRDLFFPSKRLGKEHVASPEVLRANLIHTHLLSATAVHALSESEIAAAVHVQVALNGDGILTFGWPTMIGHAFERLQSEGVGLREYAQERAEAVRKAYAEGVRYSLRAPDWNFALSDDFIKSIERVDKKIQGRVLEAITKIAQSPTVVIGDTVKPLTADLKGLWRYRIGDYRLIYAPDVDAKHITPLSFEARGDVYS